MTLRDLLAKWGLTDLRLKAGFVDATFKPQDEDRRAAWDLYVELLTRITTQPLPRNAGTEEAALASLASLFATTRAILKERGPGCIRFSRLAIAILNQQLRPVTAHWHGRLQDGAFASAEDRDTFRDDLDRLRPVLVRFAGLLADLADVEDLTAIQPGDVAVDEG